MAPLLAQAGISPLLPLASPLARVSQQQYAILLRVLRRRLRDELWGLTAQPIRPGVFGQGLQQLVRCATLGEALRRGFAFYDLLLPDFVVRLSVAGGEARIRFVLRRPADQRLAYAIKAFMLFTFGSASWLVARRVPSWRWNTRGPRSMVRTPRGCTSRRCGMVSRTSAWAW